MPASWFLNFGHSERNQNRPMKVSLSTEANLQVAIYLTMRREEDAHATYMYTVTFNPAQHGNRRVTFNCTCTHGPHIENKQNKRNDFVCVLFTIWHLGISFLCVGQPQMANSINPGTCPGNQFLRHA